MSDKCPICAEEGGHLIGCEWPHMIERNLHLTKGTVGLCQRIVSLETRLKTLERVREAANIVFTSLGDVVVFNGHNEFYNVSTEHLRQLGQALAALEAPDA